MCLYLHLLKTRNSVSSLGKKSKTHFWQVTKAYQATVPCKQQNQHDTSRGTSRLGHGWETFMKYSFIVSQENAKENQMLKRNNYRYTELFMYVTVRIRNAHSSSVMIMLTFT